MKLSCLYIIIVFSTVTKTVTAQLVDSVLVKEVDMLKHRLPSINAKNKGDSLGYNKSEFLDLNNAYVADSLRDTNAGKLLIRSDSLKKSLTNKAQSATHFQLPEIQTQVTGLDSLKIVENTVNEKVDSLKELAEQWGVSPNVSHDIQDLIPQVDSSPLNVEIPAIPALHETPNLNMDGTIVNENSPVNQFSFNNDLTVPTDPLSDVSGRADKVTDTLTNSLDRVTEEYTEEMEQATSYYQNISDVDEDGIQRSEKVDVLVENELIKIDELQALQQSGSEADQVMQLADTAQHAEALKAKCASLAKELAFDVVIKNKSKIDASLAQVSKYKGRFSRIQKGTKFHKRTANPMSNLSWRERVVPGVTFQTVQAHGLYVQFDPQLYYKLNGNIVAGVGSMYRFSFVPQEMSFDNFGVLSGVKIFTRSYFFKGFYLQAEAQQIRWRPFDKLTKDLHPWQDETVVAAGIGKRYKIGKKIKGTTEALYHYSFGDVSPYKPKIMMRIGIDISLKKRRKPSWKKTLQELKTKRSINERG